ncbi:MAG: hypothetical protein WAN30_04515 [Acidimicrobiales bacterium]
MLRESPEGPFHQLAARIVSEVAPPAGAPGCSARMLDALERAVQVSS